MELAVFGAILIFVVSVIVRQAMSASYMQNQYLKAMRQAMTISYKYSQGLLGKPDDASHNTASILFIEDRLTADSAKYGALDRTPYVVSGSATHSRNLLLPVEADEDYNLPVFDMFINGKHFPFRTAKFKEVELARSCAGADCSTHSECNGDCSQAPTFPCAGAFPCPPACTDCSITDLGFYSESGTFPCAGAFPCPPACTDCSITDLGFYSGWDSLQFYPGENLCRDSCNVNLCAGAGDCAAGSTKTWKMPWEPNCVTVTGLCSFECVTSGCTTCCNPGAGDCSAPVCDEYGCTGATFETTVGCAKLYRTIPRHKDFSEWCDDDGGKVCPVLGDSDYNLTADERFDLDRDGTWAPIDTGEPGAGQRKDFAWQWYLVLGLDKTNDHGSSYYGTALQPSSTRGAGIVLEPADCEDDCADPQNTALDVDGDLKIEGLMAEVPGSGVAEYGVDEKTGVVYKVKVMDSQDGDMDFTRGDSDTGPAPGLTKDMRMYTRVREGTYLQIEEGKLYLADGDASQYVRTTQQKDQIELIERTIQLSNDTDYFCDSGGNVVTQYINNSNIGKPPIWTASLPNPVEACNDCRFSNVALTCMEEDPAGDGTQPPVIYVRSRVVDRHGRKWITNTSSDAYVEFVTPPVP